MNIITDIEEINKTQDKPIHKEDAALQGIKDFFVQALGGLRPAIEAEEAERPCKILINILPPMEQMGLPPDQQDEGLRMTLVGYSDDLSIKIHQAISGILDASIQKILPGHNPN